MLLNNKQSILQLFKLKIKSEISDSDRDVVEIFLDVTPCRLVKFANVSKERIDFNFRIKQSKGFTLKMNTLLSFESSVTADQSIQHKIYQKT
jgi:hypothetical protein